MMEIKEVLDIMKKHRRLLNLRYSEDTFSVHWDVDTLAIFIETNDKAENKQKLQKIKKLFNALEVMYVERMSPKCKKCLHEENPFYSIDLKR